MLNESVQNLTEKTFGTTKQAPVDFDPKTPEEYDLVYGPALKQAEKKGDKVTVHILENERAKLVAKTTAAVAPAKIPDAIVAMEAAVTEQPTETKSQTPELSEGVTKNKKSEFTRLNKMLEAFCNAELYVNKQTLDEVKKTNEFLKKKEETAKKKDVAPPKAIVPTPTAVKVEPPPVPEPIVKPAQTERTQVPEPIVKSDSPEPTPIPRVRKREVEPADDQPRQSILDKAYSKSYNAVTNLLTGSKSDNSEVDEEILVEAKKTNELLEDAAEERKMAHALADETASERVSPVKSAAPKDLQKKNIEVENKPRTSLTSTILEKGAGILGSAGKMALPALAVAGAGAAGYAAGNWLNENTNIQENIAGGVETVKGWFGNSFEDKQKEADKKSTQDLYEKKVKEGKLTAKSAAFFEKQGVKVDKSKITEVPEAAKSSVITSVEKSVATKDANTDAAKTQQVTPPPMVLNTTNNVGSGSSSPTIISGMNIRNSESTFDRVQMQNYWSRTI
jgi:hypothetical protein